jgi:hypothetical protein
LEKRGILIFIRKIGVKKKASYIQPIEYKEKKRRKGKLSSITEYNRQGLGIKQTSFINGQKYSSSWEYDENGNSLSDEKTNSKKKKEYSINGDLLKIQYFDKVNGKLLRVEEYDTLELRYVSTTYNKTGNIKEKTETLYDSINNIYTSRLLSSNNDILYENRFYLNDSLQITKWSIIDNIQHKEFIQIMKYDHNGNKVEYTETDFDGNPIGKCILKYNDQDCLIESIYFKPIDKIKRIVIYEYEYFE